MDTFSFWGHEGSAGLFLSKSKFKQTGVHSQPRLLKRYELEYYTEVSDGYSIINGEKIPHKVGNIIIVRPGDIRYSYIGHFSAFYLHFDCYDNNLAELYLETLPHVIYAGGVSKVLDLLKDINYLLKNETSFNKLFITSKMYELIAVLNELKKINERIDAVYFQHIESINESVGYIKANYTKNISLIELADIAHMSRSHYHNVFKKLVGMTPCDYLTYRRIQESKKVLINTNVSICDVAYSVGFGSQSYFSSTFKKMTGMTPNAYRVENRSSIINSDYLL